MQITRLRDCALIFAAWGLFLIALAILQQLGLGVGFDIWPFGEDRLGVLAIQQPGAGPAVSFFWQMVADRNPLSPWCYVVFRWVILHFDAGLLFLRYLVGLALALISYGLVITLGGARQFALGLGIVVAVFMANGYFEQVYWDREIALTFSLAAVALYARFLNDGRHTTYALSLVAWFLAFAIYTIQCGAILAIGYLVLRRDRKLLLAVIDCFPYALLFVFYLAIWRTVAIRPGVYGMHFDGGKLLLSLRSILLHPDFKTIASATIPAAYASAAAAVGAACAALAWAGRGNDRPTKSLLDIVIVAALIAAPTVIIETIGDAWLAGSRWRMIYQFTTPLAYLAIAALIVSRVRLWPAAVGVLSAVAVALSLQVNAQAVEFTHSERQLRDAIAQFSTENFRDGLPPPYQFVVVLDPSYPWYSSDLLSDTYARTWFQRDGISFRVVRPKEYGAIDPAQLIKLDDDIVNNAALWGTPMGYDHVYFLKADKAGIHRMSIVTANDLKDSQIFWNREHDIRAPRPKPGR